MIFFLNFDSSMNIYKYFCNLIMDVSIESNHKKSYIFCDIKIKMKFWNVYWRKQVIQKKEIREKEEEEKIICKIFNF